LKNLDHSDPNKVLQTLLESGRHAADDTRVPIRVNESVGPARFKADPLIPGGYLANSLTIRAMRTDIFVLGDSLDDLCTPYQCACGAELDLQFWKLCPHCARSIS
jgi:hypothetical protein